MALLESISIPLGSKAPDFNLKGADDQMHALSDYTGRKALVIIFMCNHCPYVLAVIERLVRLSETFNDDIVQFIAINPNGANPDYEDDSFEKMKDFAMEHDMDFPYLIDETQEVARAYQAQCTPDIYVFNENTELAYHGRIDDSWKDASAATSHELKDAIEALVHDSVPSADQKPTMGCSIKWLS